MGFASAPAGMTFGAGVGAEAIGTGLVVTQAATVRQAAALGREADEHTH